jgi:hypothetical protein
MDNYLLGVRKLMYKDLSNSSARVARPSVARTAPHRPTPNPSPSPSVNTVAAGAAPPGRALHLFKEAHAPGNSRMQLATSVRRRQRQLPVITAIPLPTPGIPSLPTFDPNPFGPRRDDVPEAVLLGFEVCTIGLVDNVPSCLG